MNASGDELAPPKFAASPVPIPLWSRMAVIRSKQALNCGSIGSRRGKSSSNCPDRLVREKELGRNQIWSLRQPFAQLLGHEALGLTGFSLFDSFADAKHEGDVCFRRRMASFGAIDICVAKDVAALRVSDQRHLCARIARHAGGDLP